MVQEIERISRNVGSIQREGKIKTWKFLYLCTFFGLNVPKNTLIEVSVNLSTK